MDTLRCIESGYQNTCQSSVGIMSKRTIGAKGSTHLSVKSVVPMMSIIYNMHICWCKDSGRDSMFPTSVGELSTWLQYSLCKQTVSAKVVQYLLSCVEEWMSCCVHETNSLLHSVASASDHLGWNCMLEGRISIQWLLLVAPLLQRTGHQLLPQAWGLLFITMLHNIVHKQWIYRNLVIHYRGKDGLPIPEHHDIINWFEAYPLTDPDNLLPRHHFLMSTDFALLGSGPASNQLIWLANMDSACAASALTCTGTLTHAAMVNFCNPGRIAAVTSSANRTVSGLIVPFLVPAYFEFRGRERNINQ
jgi:hypothetical protein